MFKRLIASLVCLTFSFSNLQYVHAQDFSINQLPVPGTMVGESTPFAPLVLKGLVVNLQKPLEFQFIVDTGKGPQDTATIKDQANQLVKYFLAGLTIPEGDLWVNLSPYEKNRMVPAALGQTDLGRDLLAQDYILKQLTASLIYPEKDLGKEFWSRVYAKAQAQFGTTNVPVNTFNKVWILPDQAQVFENVNAAYVTKATLKVMLDEDYLALHKHMAVRNGTDSIGSQIVRAIILPEITKEVNTGKNFAPLRQIYQALILAKWYKETIQNGLLDALYTNKNKIAGVNLNDPVVKEQIYERYLKAYKKGAFNYIKEDPTPDGQVVPRKYFSGGTRMVIQVDHHGTEQEIESQKPDGAMISLTVGLVAAGAALIGGGYGLYQSILKNNYISKAKNGDVDALSWLIRKFDQILPVSWGTLTPEERNELNSGHSHLNIDRGDRIIMIRNFIKMLEGRGISKKQIVNYLLNDVWSHGIIGIEMLGELGDPRAIIELSNFSGPETIETQEPSSDYNYQWDDIEIDNPEAVAVKEAIRKLSDQAMSTPKQQDAAMNIPFTKAWYAERDRKLRLEILRKTDPEVFDKLARELSKINRISFLEALFPEALKFKSGFKLKYIPKVSEMKYTVREFTWGSPDSTAGEKNYGGTSEYTYEEYHRLEANGAFYSPSGNTGYDVSGPHEVILQEEILSIEPDQAMSTPKQKQKDAAMLGLNWILLTDSQVVGALESRLAKYFAKLDYDTLVKLVIHKNDSVREKAAEALGNLRNKKAIEVLKPLLADRYSVRNSAVEALSKLGATENQILDGEIEVLKSQNAGAIHDAIQELVKFRYQKAIEPLIVYSENFGEYSDYLFVLQALKELNANHKQLIRWHKIAVDNLKKQMRVGSHADVTKKMKLFNDISDGLHNLASAEGNYVATIKFVSPATGHLEDTGYYNGSMSYGGTESWVEDSPAQYEIQIIRRSDFAMLETPKAISKANPAENGGIDLNKINVKRNGKTVNVQIDPAQLNALEQGGFTGFSFKIESMTRISSPFQLLGINASTKQMMLVKA